MPEPGSDLAPLSGLTRTSAEYPSTEELEAVGYDLGGVNQFASEVEAAFVELAQDFQALQHKLKVTEEMLLNPEVLSRYVVDYHRTVDDRFLPYVADILDAMEGNQPQQQAAQGQVDSRQMYPQARGLGGNSMITQEMIMSREPEVLQPMGMNPIPNNVATPQQMMAQQQQMMAQHQNGQRVAAPQMPAAGGNISQDQVWGTLRQLWQSRPQDAYRYMDQIQNQYGSSVIAKPLVYQ